MYDLPVIDPGFGRDGSSSHRAGSEPPHNQHVHVVVLFPYSNEGGRLLGEETDRNGGTSPGSPGRRYRSGPSIRFASAPVRDHS